LPVFLRRRPIEPSDADLRAFYLRLLGVAAELRRGQWQLCETTGWPGDSSHLQLVAWSWIDASTRSLVVVNLGDSPAHARVHLPWSDLAGRAWHLHDRMALEWFEREGDEMASAGLYVSLSAWECHTLAFTGS